MTDRRARLLECVNAHKETAWDACEAVWELIRKQAPEEGQAYFSTFLAQIYIEDMCVSREEMDTFLSDDVLVRTVEKIDALGDRILDNLVRQKLPEAEFYASLWNKICDTTLLPGLSEQVAFLVWLWVDIRIPYYQIGEGCTMANEEFVQIRDALWPTLKKAFYILIVPLDQKTQRASLLMELADGLEDERERAVFWAYVISKLRTDVKKAQKAE